MTNTLREILNAIDIKRQYEADASIEFRKHYGDVFVANDISARNQNSFTALRPEYKDLDGKWDTFSHTYTSATITSNFGQGVAHAVGDLNEKLGNKSNQDYWNNSVGRDIGSRYSNTSEISDKIHQSIENNITINHKIDTRQYADGSWWETDYGLGLEASMIWTKADWASGQIDNFNYDNYGKSSNLTIPNFKLSNPFQDAIKHLGNARNHASPLAIDLDNDGIETTHAYESNVFFDIKNSGFANRVGWIKGDDGILALDKDGNGNIDNVTELFGDYRMSAWDELALLDTNKNNKIDSGNEKFSELRVWRDLNQNGISEAGELKSLSDYNIKEMSLNSTTLDQYQNENYISGNSTITYEGATNSASDDTTKQSIYDVHFLNDNLNTWHKGSQSEQFGNNFEIKLEALLLPLSRGYGDLPALHIAISKDETLLQMVTDFSTLDKDRLSEIPTLLENILYRWAGVDQVDSDSVSEADGSNIDARKLRFIEKFSGVTWEQLGNRDIVGHFASLDIKKAWDTVFNEMMNRIVVQGPMANIFEEATYNFATDNGGVNL